MLLALRVPELFMYLTYSCLLSGFGLVVCVVVNSLESIVGYGSTRLVVACCWRHLLILSRAPPFALDCFATNHTYLYLVAVGAGLGCVLAVFTVASSYGNTRCGTSSSMRGSRHLALRVFPGTHSDTDATWDKSYFCST